jgi:hypothetical protein
MTLEYTLSAIAVAAFLIMLGLLVWWVGDTATDCPRGKHLQVTAYYPQIIGKTTIMQPIFECRRK